MFIEHGGLVKWPYPSGPVEDKMQKKGLSLATSKVADRVISGRATAEESNRDLQSQRPRIVSLTVSRCFIVAGLFVALAPMPARAENPDIAALEAQVAALQSAALQGQVNTQQGQITTLQGQVSTLQSQLTAAKSVLALARFVSVDLGLENGVIGPHITFTGANIHIVSGIGATNDNGNPSGLGNLIIGYDEVPLVGDGPPLSPGDRGGSHNLIIGRENRFTKLAFGGLVTGRLNTVSAEGATVSGGFSNTASGLFSSVSGGLGNTASGNNASVSGGVNNTASSFEASVSGGESNVAGGINSVVIGGKGVIDNKDNSIAPKAPLNFP